MVKQFKIIVAFAVLSGLMFSCISDVAEDDKEMNAEPTSSAKLFNRIDPAVSGFDFRNDMVETQQLNYFSFMHLYIGCGVGVLDINNDGLQDVYMNGSITSNKLFLNKGNMEFEDITESSGTAGIAGFKTSVSIADVNADGFDDIYVCKSGWFEDPAMKKNLLFMNNGDLTFTEKAEEYGIADASNSAEAVFFDYDVDGDLDLFIGNTPTNFELTSRIYDLQAIYSNPEFEQYGASDKLFRNDLDKGFTDVTKESGILSDIAFALSVSVSDFSNDGLPDIFISNDFSSPDYLYVNQGDGSFVESSKDYLKHTTFFSMGSDASDVNNDGMCDLVVLDMLPEDYIKSKTTMSMTSIDAFERLVSLDYNRQYMQNMLHLNTSQDRFIEIGQYAGINKTDWSWSPLIADLDNDGFKDIFISNGIKRSVTERDYTAKIEEYRKTLGSEFTPLDALALIPSEKTSNYAFQNSNGYKFNDVSEQWGLNDFSFSQGSAYADLDNDGDLDLIVNNMDDYAFLYENTTKNNYLRISLSQNEANLKGINSKVKIEYGDQEQYIELTPNRGFFSSSETVAHFGLGDLDNVNKVTVTWLDGKRTVLEDVSANQHLIVEYENLVEPSKNENSTPLLTNVTDQYFPASIGHAENTYNDFYEQILLPHKMSALGPFVEVADVNNDGLDDFYVGGAYQQEGKIFIQLADGTFEEKPSYFHLDANFEDLGATFFDIENDGDMDLYVVSGGFEFPKGSENYIDRLYRNDGNGFFTRVKGLPTFFESGQSVESGDFNNDGFADLFVGGRVIPNQYPYTPNSYLLQNNGNGTFTDVTDEMHPDLRQIGMVTSSVWTDYNGDNTLDLVIAGEWMPITFFANRNGKLENETNSLESDQRIGWWNKIIAEDIDNDGDIDFVCGNLGLNYKFKATQEKPLHIYCDDLDKNGTYDIVLAKYSKDKLVPVRGKECTSQQIPSIAQKYPSFNSFAHSDLDDIFGEGLSTALHYEANFFSSVVLKNEGGNFTVEPLPSQAQFAPINGLIVQDLNKDNQVDIVGAGNLFGSEVETSRADAGIGTVMLQGENAFSNLDASLSGFFADGDVKDLKSIKLANDKWAILATNNNGNIQLFQLN